MPTKQELLVEANRRGLLTGEKKAMFDEAVRRGLIQAPSSPVVPADPDVPTIGADGRAVVQQQPEREPATIGQQLVGAGEAGLTMFTGATGGLAGTVGGAIRGAGREMLAGEFGTQDAARRISETAAQDAAMLTYSPRTEAGQRQTRAVGEALAPLAAVAPMAGELAALSSGLRQAAPALTQAGYKAKAAGASAAASVKKLASSADDSAYGARASGGAAATPEALQRVTTAESLPVPVKLTKGAALREAGQLSFEKEQMKTAAGAALRNRAEENNLQILQNFDQFIDDTGAQAVYSGKSATGRSVTNSLLSGLRTAKDRTSAAYNAANASVEADIPVNPRPVFDYMNNQITGSPSVAVVDAVKKYAVKNGLATADDAGNLAPTRSLTVREMESLRAAVNAHTVQDAPNMRQAAIIKQAIDDITDPVAGPLYNRARALRSKQSRIFEKRAVIARLVQNKKGSLDPKVQLNDVFQKTILDSTPEEIKFVRRVLNAHGDDGRQAWSDLQGATVDYIREQATKGLGTDSAGNNIVSTAQLNRVVNALDSDGRLDSVFGKRQAQVIRDLNDVAKYVNTVPPGTLINNSGTVATLLAAMGEMGVTGAATGLPVPVVSILNFLRTQAKSNAIKKKIQDTLNYSARVQNPRN